MQTLANILPTPLPATAPAAVRANADRSQDAQNNNNDFSKTLSANNAADTKNDAQNVQTVKSNQDSASKQDTQNTDPKQTSSDNTGKANDNTQAGNTNAKDNSNNQDAINSANAVVLIANQFIEAIPQVAPATTPAVDAATPAINTDALQATTPAVNNTPVALPVNTAADNVATSIAAPTTQANTPSNTSQIDNSAAQSNTQAAANIVAQDASLAKQVADNADSKNNSDRNKNDNAPKSTLSTPVVVAKNIQPATPQQNSSSNDNISTGSNTNQVNISDTAAKQVDADKIATFLQALDNAHSKSGAETNVSQNNIGNISNFNLIDSKTTHNATSEKLLSTTPHASPVDQVMVQFKTLAANGNNNIRIQLDPANLGKVEVQLNISADGKTNIRVIADNQNTLDSLQQGARHLEQALRDIGLKTDAGGLNFNLRDQGQDQAQQQKFATGAYTQASAAADESTQEYYSTVTQIYRLQQGGGVDIRV